jgi:hypothetical protein
MWSDHMRIEDRSIALHAEVAKRLRARPELLEIARKNLEAWIERDGDIARWVQWQRILDEPIEKILAFLVSPSQEARHLRQSSPFCGILTARERWKVYEAFAVGAYYQSRGKHR